MLNKNTTPKTVKACTDIKETEHNAETIGNTEKNYAKLIEKLCEHGQSDKIIEIAINKDLRNQLYKKYNLL